eukprot:gene11686-4921_t
MYTTKKKRLAICSFDKKLKAKPMQEIIKRLEKEITVYQIGSEEIENIPVEQWPTSDYFLCVGQKPNFPLEKAKKYIEITNSISLLDLDYQLSLRSRLEINKILQINKIPTAKSILVYREKDKKSNFSQTNDYIMVDDVKFYKPFVEKPKDAWNHDVYIYSESKDSKYNCIQLFRKVGNKSSRFVENVDSVRSEGSYIYEEYLDVESNLDIKVYVVDDYVYAESRKSPCVDGIVERREDGKEKRYLTFENSDEEIELSKRTAKCFGHFICGLDILRTKEGSFICDVNGMSFVKSNTDYYDHCAEKLLQKICQK